jgi:hypothetical protein
MQIDIEQLDRLLKFRLPVLVQDITLLDVGTITRFIERIYLRYGHSKTSYGVGNRAKIYHTFFCEDACSHDSSFSTTFYMILKNISDWSPVISFKMDAFTTCLMKIWGREVIFRIHEKFMWKTLIRPQRVICNLSLLRYLARTMWLRMMRLYTICRHLVSWCRKYRS